jgi:hypothetical protein
VDMPRSLPDLWRNGVEIADWGDLGFEAGSVDGREGSDGNIELGG